uniref:Uncharacterized protein n=1 Tax=Salix viminalis TaxID=40686 RepID=A0A6N2NIA4_SALVM
MIWHKMWKARHRIKVSSIETFSKYDECITKLSLDSLADSKEAPTSSLVCLDDYKPDQQVPSQIVISSRTDSIFPPSTIDRLVVRDDCTQRSSGDGDGSIVNMIISKYPSIKASTLIWLKSSYPASPRELSAQDYGENSGHM